MKNVSFYHKDTGLLNGVLFMTSDDSTLEMNTPADHVAIDGHHDPLCKRVDVETGEVVDHQPPQPSQDHVWTDEKRWRLSSAAQATIDRRTAAIARIAFLNNSQHRFVRQHALGDPAARKRLEEIDDEVEALEMFLEEK